VALVGLFRTFLAGGYMIETGSMAPCLLGYHRQVVCPDCRYAFAIEGSSATTKAVCPNCGRGEIAVDKLSRNDGDHLLVHRCLFEFRQPRRWEVVVFRNPNRPTQAYVKRLVALPGETVQIIDGDIYVDGEIKAKNYATQRGLRIPVNDDDCRPHSDDPEWRPRWLAEKPDNGWTESGGTFRFAPRNAESTSQCEWVSYRHWIRRGGSHVTQAALSRWPGELERPAAGIGPVAFDEDRRTLECRGALTLKMRNQYLRETGDAEFREAIERLYEASHIAPITDQYGYNRRQDGQGRHEVRDLMLSAILHLHDGPGEFRLAISDGSEAYECLFDLAVKKIRLIDSRTGRAMRTAALNDDLLDKAVCVEVSMMDRQVLLAVDGRLAFKPLSYTLTGERGPPPRQPVRFGAKGTAVEVSSLKLFRDVYYTDDPGRRGVDGPVELKSNQYFVLGDNSPVSKDSRSWADRVVLTGDMFLGKPMVVHLPSRKQRLKLWGWQTEIRIPEFSRIRYIY